MATGLFLWSLPDAWFQVDLLASDAENRIAERLTAQMGGELPAESLEKLINAEVAAARYAADHGVILLATYAEGGTGPGEIPAGLSLTLALGQLPDNPPSTESTHTGTQETGIQGAPSFAPITLADPDVNAFTREVRSEIDLAGGTGQIGQFQKQVFVMPPAKDVIAVVTVTTFDPAWEDRARTVAQTFADTLVFLDAAPEGRRP